MNIFCMTCGESSATHSCTKTNKSTLFEYCIAKLISNSHLGDSKNSGKTPKMDGENNGKPYFLMDDLGGKKPWFNTHLPWTI